MPTFSFSPDECIEETKQSKQYCVEVENNSSDNSESCMSYSGDMYDSKVVTSLETTEEIDDTLDDSNDKESAEEDGDLRHLIVFPWYDSNDYLNLIIQKLQK